MSAVLIYAFHATLEDRELTFDGVGVDSRINLRHVFALTVPSISMLGKVLAHMFVLACFISHDARLTRNIGLQNRQQGFGFQIVNHDTASLAGSAVNE